MANSSFSFFFVFCITEIDILFNLIQISMSRKKIITKQQRQKAGCWFYHMAICSRHHHFIIIKITDNFTIQFTVYKVLEGESKEGYEQKAVIFFVQFLDPLDIIIPIFFSPLFLSNTHTFLCSTSEKKYNIAKSIMNEHTRPITK